MTKMQARATTKPATHHPSNFSIKGENPTGKNKSAKKATDAHINVTRIRESVTNDRRSPQSAERQAFSLANVWFFIKMKDWGKKPLQMPDMEATTQDL